MDDDYNYDEAAARDIANEYVDELKETIGNAYLERNRLVAVLASLYPSGTKRTDIPGWDPEWHNCVYVDIPGCGQVSWHYHDNDAFLFDCLPAYEGGWDGHTTDEKYEKLSEWSGDVLRKRLLEKRLKAVVLPPKDYRGYQFHWLNSDKLGKQIVWEWYEGVWWSTQCPDALSPLQVFERGWEYAAPVEMPARKKP